MPGMAYKKIKTTPNCTLWKDIWKMKAEHQTARHSCEGRNPLFLETFFNDET